MILLVRSSLAISFLMVGLGLVGCGGDGKVAVSGTVTWNGESIPEDHIGHIVFTPTDPTLAPDATKLKGGEFSFRASPGDKRVEIFIDRPKTKDVDVMGAPEREPYIPKRYNEETELDATVTPGEENSFDFALELKKGDKIAGVD